MKQHANSKSNQAEHHLYEIFDSKEDDVFKYGICGKPLNKDGTSPRAKAQARYLSGVRYLVTILFTGIFGRAKAVEMEDELIEAYRQKNGRRPYGNPEKKDDL
jgi:hypothetical protein